MSPKLSIATLLVCASCASATGSHPDAGRADARVRADAGDGDASEASPDAGGADSGPSGPDAAPTPANVLITEIVDATLPNGLPKFVELTNIGGMAADLSGYSLGVYSNGNTTLLNNNSVLLSGSLAANASYVVSFENSDGVGSGTFQSVYGMDPDHFAFAAVINGNDVIHLFLADGGGAGGVATGTGADATLVDAYGVVGAGGSPGGGIGEVWEYTDGHASRKQGTTGPAATFDDSQWQFSGADALDGLDASGIAAVTSPSTY